MGFMPDIKLVKSAQLPFHHSNYIFSYVIENITFYFIKNKNY